MNQVSQTQEPQQREYRLEVVNGYLALGDERFLFRYPEGDCDYVSWPWKDEKKESKQLESVLFDKGNMDVEDGGLKEGDVYLPDGRLFGRVVLCGFNREE